MVESSPWLQLRTIVVQRPGPDVTQFARAEDVGPYPIRRAPETIELEVSITLKGGPHMFANVGDQLIIEGHRIGLPRRKGKVEEVRGADGGPPYLVRWDDTGRATLLFPGVDCRVEHLTGAEKESQ